MNTHNHVSSRFCAVCLSALSMLSCAGGQPGELTVLPGMVVASGEVTLDDQPLETGQITFMNENATNPEDQDQWVLAKISKGEFKVQIPPGRYVVRIQKYQYDKKGREGKPVLPPKYDQKTTLSAEITEGGSNQLLFPLESK